MDKIAKALLKLTQKERARVKAIIQQLIQGNLGNLDIKKLKGFEDIFRVRTGEIRIVYVSNEKGVIILKIDRRNEKTYDL